MIKKSIIDGLKNSYSTILFIAKIIIPVMFVVKVLDYIDFIYYFSKFLKPFMSMFDLPGESAISLLLGNFINLYASLATFATIHFTDAQITTISIMLLISHSQITECAVISKLGVKVKYILFLRLITMAIVGLIMSVML